MTWLPSPPPPDVLAAAIIGFLGGLSVPTRYGLERLNGFGRWMAGKLPYEPPPGQDEGEALEEAIEED